MTLLADQLEKSASAFEDAVAILSNAGHALTYLELCEEAKKIAACLARMGVQPGDPVAVSLPNGMIQALSILGVASYTACLALDPALNSQELKRILSESNAVAFISSHPQTKELKRLLEQLDVRAISIDWIHSVEEKTIRLRASTRNRINRSHDNNNPEYAVILCTSGSTSQPKLVPQTQVGIVTAADDLAKWFQLQTQDRCLGCMPLFHGNGLYAGLFPAIVSGGSFLCLDSFAPGEFFRSLSRHQPTWLTTIPTSLQALMRHINENPGLNTRSPLRFIRAGSAHLPQETKTAIERLLGVPVIAGYGSAEAAHITNNPLPPKKRKSGSVGLPCGNEVKVVDTDGNQVGAEEVGEVCVRGPSVTPGYLGETKGNDDLFKKGWLRTGDQGFFDCEGYLTLVGRTKQMINRGGESISPIEIQNVISSHPQVLEAAVFAVPHATLGETVAAAVVPRPGSKLTQTALQSFLGDRLSPQKIPYRVLQLDQIPINNIGKIQLSELVKWFADSRPEKIEPRNQEEAIIARLWSKTLGKNVQGVTDHFVDYGGDSLSALSLLTKINQEFGTDLQISDILQAGTIEAQRHVILSHKERNSPKRNPIQKSDQHKVNTELSIQELGLYLTQQIDPDNIAYNTVTAIRFIGKLNVTTLERSLQQIIERHETLRTTYSYNVDNVIRTVNAKPSLQFHKLDLQFSGEPRASLEAQAEKLIIDDSRRPFDLSEGPLIRCHLYQIDKDTHVLALILHHIITDGWSTGILIRELGELYRHHGKQTKISLPVLPIEYSDYAAWQRNREADHKTHLKFWRRQLADQPIYLEMPTDRPIFGLRSGNGGIVYRTTRHQLGKKVRRMSQQIQTTPFVTLEAAFKVLLYQLSGSTDISIGTPAANRDQSEVQNLIGCFISMLVLRSRLNGNSTFKDFLEDERESCYAAYKHQEVPIQAIVAEIAPKRRHPGIQPLFQVVFQLRAHTAIDLTGTGVKGERVMMHNGISKYDLSVEISFRTDNELDIWAEYSSDIYDEARVYKFLEQYEHVLFQATEEPETKLKNLGA